MTDCLKIEGGRSSADLSWIAGVALLRRARISPGWRICFMLMCGFA